MNILVSSREGVLKVQLPLEFVKHPMHIFIQHENHNHSYCIGLTITIHIVLG
jgi:hypothetical protein